MTDEVKRCKADRHDLVPPNAKLNKSTGRLYCSACRSEKRRAAREATGKCPAGKHSFSNPANVYTTPFGKRKCRACWFQAKAKREAAAAVLAAEIAAAKAARVPPRRQMRTMTPRGGGNRADALYRLAVMVRRSRGIDV